jgi:L-asparaginase / beta-aspartyl-peptidase
LKKEIKFSSDHNRKSARRKFLGDLTKGLGVVALAQSTNITNADAGPASAGVTLNSAGKFGFVIHGGAGTILRSKMSAAMEQAYRDQLTGALQAGHKILSSGGGGLDAIEAALRLLEDSPLFNAGKGAVFTNAGTNELDASIMDGSNLKAGAVAAVKHIRNPISLARKVMEHSPHVMMVGEGAETFAKEQGMKLVPQSYFFTERRWKELQEDKAEERKQKVETGSRPKQMHAAPPDGVHFDKHGTVGAAALDQQGNLTAGTSTGGLDNKRWGRVGDSPIIGAGTYANNLTCAISATGDGEYFMRSVVAHDISALMQYAGKSLQEAARLVIEKVGKLGGTGGVIGIDKEGHVAQVFNTPGMYRGRIDAAGKVVVEIYKD